MNRKWFGTCRVEVDRETVTVVVPWTAADENKRRALAYAAKYSHDTDAGVFIPPAGRYDVYLYANVEALSATTSQTA